MAFEDKWQKLHTTTLRERKLHAWYEWECEHDPKRTRFFQQRYYTGRAYPKRPTTGELKTTIMQAIAHIKYWRKVYVYDDSPLGAVTCLWREALSSVYLKGRNGGKWEDAFVYDDEHADWGNRTVVIFKDGSISLGSSWLHNTTEQLSRQDMPQVYSYENVILDEKNFFEEFLVDKISGR